MKTKIPAGARQILQTLTASGREAHLVGGCVRDLLRGVPPHDWDICTSALPEETKEYFTGRKVIETGLKHGTVTILTPDGAYEVTTYRADGAYTDGRRPDRVRFVSSLREDLARRDFTMNAIAMSLDGALQDPFGGAADIQAGRIRCVGDPVRRFQEDGLRLMRALRFSAVLGYAIEPQTAKALRRSRAMLDHVAGERIRVELSKLLTAPHAGAVLRQYPDILCQFWPELAPLVELEQHNPWHCWGGWEHTIRALEAAPANEVLRLTMLLHDIGKPACKSTDEAGVDHFYGHPEVSAQLARTMLRRLKCDNATRRQVVTLVERHDIQLSPTDKAIRRWLNRLGPETFYQLLAVKRADGMGQDQEKVRDRLQMLENIRARTDEIIAQGQCFSLKDLAISGQDVIAAGVTPGPEVGRALKQALEQVLSGQIPNERSALLELIKRKA